MRPPHRSDSSDTHRSQDSSDALLRSQDSSDAQDHANVLLNPEVWGSYTRALTEYIAEHGAPPDEDVIVGDLLLGAWYLGVIELINSGELPPALADDFGGVLASS